MGFIDISVGDLVFSKTERADLPADATAESTDSTEETESVATDEEDEPADVASGASSGQRGRLHRQVTRGRLRTAGKTVGGIATFVVVLFGLVAVALAVALAIALKVRRTL